MVVLQAHLSSLASQLHALQVQAQAARSLRLSRSNTLHRATWGRASKEGSSAGSGEEVSARLLPTLGVGMVANAVLVGDGSLAGRLALLRPAGQRA